MLPAVVLLLLVLLVDGSGAHCPRQCSCMLDIRGRRQVTCSQGGMADPIPILSMDPHVEVLQISAPEHNQNTLTIGPIFKQFSQLEELHIVESNVPAIGHHSFWGVPTLKVLNLTHNNISQVGESNFRGLANLVELHLDDNRISTMESATFRHLPELRVLTLANNRIGELVPRLFLMLVKLRHLDLSGNPLAELNPEVFKDIQELRVLACRSCGLRNINTHIYSLLTVLSHLDLGDNQFKYLASDEFHALSRLQVLRLDGNQLPVVLERTFQAQARLQTLNLARNRLAKVTSTAFANLTTLKELDLGYNKLDRLETVTFQPLAESLRVFHVSGNALPMSELKYVLQVVLKMKELSMADMGLAELPLGLLVYLEHLRFLNLSGNHMVHFPAQVLAPVSRLTELDLSRNRFRGLDERLLTRLETVPNVHLQGNPWSCDLCHITTMLSRLNRSESLQRVECAYPPALSGHRLGSLNPSGLGWCGSGFGYREDGFAMTLTHKSQLGLIAAGAAVALLIITCAVILAGTLYARHHAAHYYTHEEKRDEAVFHNRAALLDDRPKKVSIATIDEITKDPDLQIVANGNAT